MLLDPLFLVILQEQEGYSEKKYKDTEGFWTIGYGHKLLPEDKLRTLTRRQAFDLLMLDAARVEKQLTDAMHWTASLDSVRYGVLHNMAFNLGVAGLSKFRKTLAHIKAGRYAEASVEMLKSKWAKQVKERAVKLARYMKEGKIC